MPVLNSYVVHLSDRALRILAHILGTFAVSVLHCQPLVPEFEALIIGVSPSAVIQIRIRIALVDRLRLSHPVIQAGADGGFRARHSPLAKAQQKLIFQWAGFIGPLQG